jgi:hypothetical protein
MHQETLTAIVASYAPYDTMEAFGEGFVAYQHGRYSNPYDGKRNEGCKAQAWDRGLEAASRYARAEAERNAVNDFMPRC